MRSAVCCNLGHTGKASAIVWEEISRVVVERARERELDCLQLLVRIQHRDPGVIYIQSAVRGNERSPADYDPRTDARVSVC